ncbi:MAG: carbonic anhydrase, partial [Rhodospirillales bacterium]
LFESLADKGQTPKTMIISCCDSRVEPAAIFNTKPGELFVVRNVANLVPPYSPEGDFHGTSAALEFAVCGLEVEHIVILGHSRCGGIKAYLDGAYDPGVGGDFIVNWMSIIQSARDQVLNKHADENPEKLLRMLEQTAIGTSLNNLMHFPFIQEKVAANKLQLHGGFFDIASGELFARDPESADFKPL